MRNDTRVQQIDIGTSGVNFDFTDTNQTYASIEGALKEVRDVMWITNNYGTDLTLYISREIASNLERNSSESYSSLKIIDRLAQLMGIAGIKTSSKLSGNEFFGMPLPASTIYFEATGVRQVFEGIVAMAGPNAVPGQTRLPMARLTRWRL